MPRLLFLFRPINFHFPECGVNTVAVSIFVRYAVRRTALLSFGRFEPP